MAGQLTWSTCNYAVSQSLHSADLWDTITVTGNITCQGTGLTFVTGTHHWVLDLRGADGIAKNADDDTIYFATDAFNSVAYGAYGTPACFAGVRIMQTAHDIKFIGGILWHLPDNITGEETEFSRADTNRTYGIGSSVNIYNVTLDSMTIRVTGGYFQSMCFSIGGAKMVTVRHCTFINDAYALEDRQDFLVGCLMSQGLITANLSAGEYHIYSEYNHYESHCHTACRTTCSYGSSATESLSVQHYRDTIIMDTRNEFADSCMAIFDNIDKCQYAGTVNAYGIIARSWGSDSYIKECYINSGETYNGGRALLFEHINASFSDPMEVSNNRIICHEGLVYPLNTTGYVTAAKWREHCRGVYFHDNIITMKFDVVAAGNYGTGYSEKGECGCMQYHSYFITGDSLHTRHNTCSTQVITPTATEDWEIAGWKWDDYLNDSSHLHIGNVFFIQGTWAYDFGQYDGGSGGMIIREDTLYLYNDWISTAQKGTFNWGAEGGTSEGGFPGSVADMQWARDIYYNDTGTYNDASPTAVTYYYRGDLKTTACDTCDLTIQRTLDLLVHSGTGADLSGVILTVMNNYNDTVLVDTTGSDGIASGVVSYYYLVDAYDAGGDSTGFKPFTLYFDTDANGVADTTLTMNVDWNVYADTLVWGEGQQGTTVIKFGRANIGRIRK